jgi:O-methyltransferase
MQKNSKELYLELLKKTISFMLWPEPPHRVEPHLNKRKLLPRLFYRFISSYLNKRGMFIAQAGNFREEERTDGTIWPGYADTMIGLKRLDNLQNCIETVIHENTEGDLIECGVWRGGACIFMRGILKVYGAANRKIFVADSFEGLPKPEPQKYPADAGDKHHTFKELAISKEVVENNFKKYDLLDNNVVFLKGWFKDTLPQAPINQLSILRLDGDMYSSTIEALSILYPKLSKGGFCIIDDYALKGCKEAVDDYRKEQDIQTPLEKIDWSGVFWQKQ